jgi:trans-aconitate 2-methyltransferase
MYSWNAADYAQHSAGQARWAAELLEQLALAPDAVVLDVGCGDGRTTAAIADRVPRGRVVGVDLSASMVEHARREHVPGRRNLTFVRADMCALPFAPGFTVAFSNAVLHWVRDHPTVLAGIARALLPGGRVLMQMGGRGNAVAVTRALERVTTRAPWRPYFEGFVSTYGFFGPAEYEGWMPAAGFVETRARLVEKLMVHADRAAFLGWLRTAWHPYTACLPASLKDAFLDEVVREYLEGHPPDGDGRVTNTMIRLQVEGTYHPD